MPFDCGCGLRVGVEPGLDANLSQQRFGVLRDPTEANFDGRDDEVLNVFALDPFGGRDMGDGLPVGQSVGGSRRAKRTQKHSMTRL